VKKVFQFFVSIITMSVTMHVFALTNSATINWMSQIPDNRTLNQLIIPGTRDSGTADITENTYFSYNGQTPLPLWLQVIANIVPHSILRGITADWSKTQPYSITQQLNSGIRYFDFQVCHENLPGRATDFYLCNSLISGPLADAVDNIVMFVSAHPSELVMINISHVYGVENTLQETALVSLLNALLFNVDVPNTLTPNGTMGALRQTNRHVIIFMDPQYDVQDPGQLLKKFEELYLWHNASIDAPQPNASDISTLKQTLDAEVALRASTHNTSHQFFVLQATQTPSPTNVIDGILNKNQYPHSLQGYEQPVNDHLNDWLGAYIEKYHAFALNIVTQDWFTDSSPLVNLAMKYDSLPEDTSNINHEEKTDLQQKLLQLKKLYKH